MIVSTDIDALVRNTARDDVPSLRKFSKAELVMYINAASRWIVALDSTANVTTEAISLKAGTHQGLPAGGIRIIEFWNNDSGTTRERIDGRVYKGRDAVREVPLSEVRSTLPQWASARETQIAVNVIFNKDDPVHFMVYPPNKGDGKIVVTYTKQPQEITEISDTDLIELPEIYANVVASYVLYKMLSRADEQAGENVENMDKAEYFYNKALQQLQIKEMADQTSTPTDTAGM